MNTVLPLLFAVGFVFAPLIAAAHEVRPAYLELREDKPGQFSVLFKTPQWGDARLALTAVFSGKVEAITPIVSRQTNDAVVQTWRIRANDPLAGQRVSIDGLSSTMTDALVRIEFADVAPGSSG